MCAAETRFTAPRRASQRGLTLVELLVGIVVSMLIGLAAMGTAITFSATQRQAVNSGGTASGLLTTLNGLKVQVSQAGLGFYQDGSYACPTMNMSVDGVKHFDNAVFAPLSAGVETVDRFDNLGVIYATDVLAGSRVLLKGAAELSTTTLLLDSLIPQSVVGPVGNDQRAIMLIGAAGSATPCTIRTVTGWTAPDPLINRPLTLTVGAAGRHNQVAFTQPVTYGANEAMVSVLGAVNWWRFRIVDASTNEDVDGSTSLGNLVVERPLSGDTAVLERNVVAFKIQYGLASSDATEDTSVTSWQVPTGSWSALDSANEIGRIRALRIGLVVRGDLPRDATQESCDTTVTPDPLVLFRNSTEPFEFEPPDSDGNDGRCYRYRQAEIVVPMRNVVLGREAVLPTAP